MAKIPVILVILDGFGVSLEKTGNAVSRAKTPNFDYLSANYKGMTLQASSTEVGLAWGEMGSSEVGHANLGAGLVVYQNLERINSAIKDGTFLRLPVWKSAIDHAVKYQSAIHIMGLVSNGGVHSHIEHLFAILAAIQLGGFRGNVFIHVFTDGQDVSPASAPIFVEALEKELLKIGIGKIATVIGRYYAMDKNDNWDRTQKAYVCMAGGIGERAASASEAIKASYAAGTKDEEILPTVILDSSAEPIGAVKDNDALIFINFRADRARQLTQAFIDPVFNSFPRGQLQNLLFIPMSDYGLPSQPPIAFPSQRINNPLSAVISAAGMNQLHIAEKEKYAHVTYFFNGGVENPFSKEDRQIAPSKKVASFDLAPEMSANEITEKIIAAVRGGNYDFIMANFANGDIVGHTGNFDAGVKTVEVLDECIGRIMKEVLAIGGVMLITADHGNVEEMINLKTGEMDKEHSTNPVPFWIVGAGFEFKDAGQSTIDRLEPGGILADVAPTILELLRLVPPREMTGSSLLSGITRFKLPK